MHVKVEPKEVEVKTSRAKFMNVSTDLTFHQSRLQLLLNSILRP